MEAFIFHLFVVMKPHATSSQNRYPGCLASYQCAGRNNRTAASDMVEAIFCLFSYGNVLSTFTTPLENLAAANNDTNPTPDAPMANKITKSYPPTSQSKAAIVGAAAAAPRYGTARDPEINPKLLRPKSSAVITGRIMLITPNPAPSNRMKLTRKTGTVPEPSKNKAAIPIDM